MKILITFLFFIPLTFTTFSQQANYADFPVTTKSSLALRHYYLGVEALNNVHVYESMNNFNKALEQDPEFFMPNFIFAMLNLFRPNPQPFLSFASKAIHCKNLLNESEKLIRQALVQLMLDPRADVTGYGEKLVRLNPGSYLALSILAGFQISIKDYKNVNNTYQAILHLPHYPAIVFDSMGKNYMRMNQMDKAKEAFDQYLKAAPANANAYCSMGDYYTQLENYQNAYDYYLKAYQLDSIQYKSPNKNNMKGKLDMTNY
jgi:tetratricopeptide (TPR) repeat protein